MLRFDRKGKPRARELEEKVGRIPEVGSCFRKSDPAAMLTLEKASLFIKIGE